MKEYYVWSDYNDIKSVWIVSAKNAKDAVQQVYDSYIIHFNKLIKDNNNGIKAHGKENLHARSLGSLHNEYGKIILLN